MLGRGQIFTLDLLISLVAATLAIGLLFHAMELQVYNQKEAEIAGDLQRVAENAGTLLASSNAITCELRSVPAAGATRLDYLNNCVDTLKINSGNAKALLGIPADYKWHVLCPTCTPAIDWGDTLPGAETDFYEEKRTAIFSSGAVSKAIFEARSFSSKPIAVRVWKE